MLDLNYKLNNNLENKSRKIINVYKPKLTKKKKVYCSPSNRKNKYSCFTKPSLLKIAKTWNQNNSENKIVLGSANTVKKIWKRINGKLKEKCYGEWCWIEQDFVKSLQDEEINNTFRPKLPREWCHKTRDWLSTTDIESVMVQYEDVYDDFYFIGPVPIDFDDELSAGYCVVDELCKINLKNLKKKGIKRVGIVFNLDKHTETGSHWIAMFLDLNKQGIYYWDSYGEKPPKEVRILVKKLQSQGKNMKLNLKYQRNTKRHQFKTSECGVYCMYFIVKLLQGKKFKEFTHQIVKDDEMNTKRGYFYSPTCEADSM